MTTLLDVLGQEEGSCKHAEDNWCIKFNSRLSVLGFIIVDVGELGSLGEDEVNRIVEVIFEGVPDNISLVSCLEGSC